MDNTSLDDNDSDSNKTDKGPSPTDLEAFLPWACAQLQFTFNIVLNKITLNDSMRGNTNRSKVRDDVNCSDSQTTNCMNLAHVLPHEHRTIYIDIVYDSNDYLVQLKFKKNTNIPNKLLKLFSLIVQFHPRLSAIYINRGLNQSGLYQVSKIIASSNLNITEVILDNTVLEQANYYILLEDNCHLKYVSLARCKLNDSALEVFASKLDYPLKASKTLSVLNLSTNRITDEGAKYLADILRRNRQLSFLNLSGNMITDIGAESIFISLKLFPLTDDEINQKKARKFEYMKEKKKFIKETIEKMRIDFEKRYSARKRGKSEITPTKRAKSAEIGVETNTMSIADLDTIWLEKAQAAAEEMVGKFEDPFNDENTTSRGEILYCYGNNALRYLNLAYNNLTYLSVQKINEVLRLQNTWDRKPKGLVKVCIEGNNLPVACQELLEIDAYLEIGLARITSAIVRKKAGARTFQK